MRERLLEGLAKLKHPQMWTFTVDDKVGDPKIVFEHVKQKRAIQATIKELHRRGLLKSRAYFCVQEFQLGDRREDGMEGTGQVHFHVILDVPEHFTNPDSGFLDIRQVQGIWNSFRPEWAANDPLHAYAFGKVNFRPIHDRKGLAIYAAKYMTKAGEGLPDWFKSLLDDPDRRSKAVMYSHSRGFMPAVNRKNPARKKKETKPRQWRSMSKRLEQCRDGAAICRRRVEMKADGEVIIRHDYLGTVAKEWGELVEAFNWDEMVEATGYVFLRSDEYLDLAELSGIKVITHDIKSGESHGQERKNGVSSAVIPGTSGVFGPGGRAATSVAKLVDRGPSATLEKEAGIPTLAAGKVHVSSQERKVTNVREGTKKGLRNAAGGELSEALPRDSQVQQVLFEWVYKSTAFLTPDGIARARQHESLRDGGQCDSTSEEG